MLHRISFFFWEKKRKQRNGIYLAPDAITQLAKCLLVVASITQSVELTPEVFMNNSYRLHLYIYIYILTL